MLEALVTRLFLYDKLLYTKEMPRFKKLSQLQASKQSKKDAPEVKEDSQLNKFLSKYTEDDDIEQESRLKLPIRKSKKEPKPEITTKNRLFTDCHFDDKAYQHRVQEFQQLEIDVVKKQRSQSGDLLQKFQKKAEFCKNRLDYKDSHMDHKYKQHIQHTLKEMQDFEQVELTVGVPKVGKGKSCTSVDNALFLKNMEKKNTQTQEDNSSRFSLNSIKESQLQSRQSLPKDSRSSFGISDMPKKQISQDNFSLKREPSLGDKSKKDKSSKKKSQKTQKSQKSQKGKDDGHNSIKMVSKRSKIDQKNTIQEQAQRKQKSEDSNPIIAKPAPEKKAKNIKKKNSEFKYLDLIEFQAEMSDDEQDGGPRHNDENDGSSQNGSSINSMIDDSIQVNDDDRILIHQKFIKDVIEEDERKYEEMRKKVEKNYIQEEERLNKRMKEAAKRNMQKDEGENSILYQADKLDEVKSESKTTSNSTSLKQRNNKKLEELDLMLGKQKKVDKQTQKTMTMELSSKLDSIEKNLFGGAILSQKQKVDRRGLKNAQLKKKVVPFKTSK